ncbi:hypothetical protein [uncultured Gilvimarinus sp.]|uniref:hypothetical protein n=1 Tax=uncultured Gilvimarinus sp. TaxID=1689143 RepID=UPI0030DCEACD
MYNALWVVGILVVLVAGVVFKSHPIVLDRLNGGYPWAFDDRGVHKALSRRASSMVDDFSYSGLPARVEREPGGYYAVHRYRVVAGDGEVRDYYVSAHLDINYKVKSVGEPVEGKIY